MDLREAFRLWRHVEDDVKEPYSSKYKASEMLDTLSKNHPKETIRNLASGRRALIFSETEEPTKARKLLEKVVAYFCPKTQLNKKACMIDDIHDRILPFASDIMKFFNALGCLHFAEEKAEWYHDLKTSLSIYSEIVKLRKKNVFEEDVSSLSSLSECWDDSPDGQAALSLFYLAQMVSRRGQKGDREMSAKFLYRTLEMRHEQLLREMNAHNAIEWTSCVIGMARYHRGEDNKIQALSLIESGANMLRRCANLSNWKETERFREVQVELSRLRSLLYVDTMRAAVRDHCDTSSTAVPDTKIIPKAFPMCEDTTSSSSLCLLDPSYLRDNLPCAMRASFRIARSGLEKALAYYKLDGYVSEHVEISRELCRAYSYVAMGEGESEENVSMRIKIYRRMIKILEPVFECLSRDVYLDTCIVLAFELAEGCVSLQMVKETQLKRSKCAKLASIVRIRKYAADAVKYFDAFCDLVEKEGRGEINEDRVVSYVRAQLHGARMTMKKSLGFEDIKMKIESVRAACDKLRSLRDFAAEHIIQGSETAQILKEEMRLCHESLNLHTLYLNQYEEQLK